MLIKDALGQEVGVGDILMLSFSYTSRHLEPALLINIGKGNRIGGADFYQIKFLIKDPDTLKISEYTENIFAENSLEAWIESGIRINNPEFFIHDDRVSKLIAERLGIIGK